MPESLAEDGVAAARVLPVDGFLPTAGVAYDDACAAGLVDSLTRAGLSIPGDISIVRYDGTRLSRLSHSNLTTVGQDARRLVRFAVGPRSRQPERLPGF